MSSGARGLAVVLAGTLLVSAVATAERYLVTAPLGGAGEQAIRLAGDARLEPTPSRSQSAAGILQVARTGVYLGTVRGVVTLAGPDDPPAGATVRFTLYGDRQQVWTDATAPYAVSVDTRAFPNGGYRLAVETRWPGGMSTHVATLMIDNAAGPSPSATAGPTPSARPATTSSPAPAARTTTTTTTTTTKARRTTTTTRRPTTTKGSSGGSSNPSFTDEVVRLTNVERAGNGCGALGIDATLTKVAQTHSQDMATDDFFSHDSQDGRSPFDRMSAAGYEYSTAAENIAAGQSTPASVVEGWMNSPGHRANILNCSLKEIGVGYATSSSSKFRTYWTQDFGTPR